ncbi:unnamed protein product, partial [Mesorhabditis belari]|uniref:Poly [ADP-ribose] polymerase n=1 Tax=Mesorhabditis belari TaxID=2138241 RepID=A0AAF3J661_9BILA
MARTRKQAKAAEQAADEPVEDQPGPSDAPAQKRRRVAPGAVKPKEKVKEEEKDADEEEEEKPETNHKSAPRVVRCVGPAPVFESCSIKEKSVVYAMQDSVYSVMLNKTDIGNNNNKFYGIQVLQLENNQFGCFLWWGRVGYAGQNSLARFPSAIGATNMFCSKFSAKTGLAWDERNEAAVYGKYRLVEIDQFQDTLDKENEGNEQDADDKVKQEVPDSVLAAEIQEVIKMITNLSMLANGIRSIELSYENSEKMPLGKLTAAQLERGYENLKELENLLKRKKCDRSLLIRATNDFYSNIPHSLGFSRPKVIDDMDEVKAKCELLDTLKEVQIAIKTIKEGENGIKEEQNPIDRMYLSLKCDFQVVSPKSANFKMIQDYMQKTHASTHTFAMKIKTVFEVKRHVEDERFIDHGNKMLLWHGSRLTNFCGILSHGLRIAPPEAPCTGYMFGKGIYFADSSSKSGNYCYPKNKEEGLLVLAEVSLGVVNEKKGADYDASKLPAGKHSTFGMGQWAPSSGKQSFKKIFDDVVVPMGPLERVTDRTDCSLLYNEYIVYNEAQVRLRFLVQTEFSDDLDI